MLGLGAVQIWGGEGKEKSLSSQSLLNILFHLNIKRPVP